MASYRSFTTSPFSEAVVECMRRIYPESLADKSFDNTGLLLEAPLNTQRQLRNSVLLTVDLTQAVADEAIEHGDSIVIAYHPIIFRGLKSITSSNTQQRTLLRLAAEGISVYSPHTAVDAVPGGMADWLCDIVTCPRDPPRPATGGHAVADELLASAKAASSSSPPPPPLPPRAESRSMASHLIFPSSQLPSPETATTGSEIPHSRSTISPNPAPPPGFENAGTGRLVSFSAPQPLGSLLRHIACGIGMPRGLPHFPLALPPNSNLDMKISTVATCPGSGSSILMKNGKPVADLLLTGEISHHDALAAIENGSAVVSLFHSNSERGYLGERMRRKLEAALRLEWGQMIEDLADLPETSTSGVADCLNDPTVDVRVSERDRDPYGIVVFPEA
ncbi:hypothetical protein LOZ65_005444 [Ophidiomyces ophidiicola]|nr:hypothetical protein LOZ65_005444 [Ophidiomyces ophidiicola]